eukprot:gnl/TRDRNA2_/TRDRNA2_165164_c4_seq1.p1 gnl/TRDRNA2_/TRDRNA2_165164_c4~~gnl/TRDRNA2_/TRDRNA2_165164_c4_seq1.p1  ORF type:complete len:1136 (+),score=175.98 gnl/TRDRNA2_/TRDRNA2_165164_c4_seq1:238-3408(+)
MTTRHVEETYESHWMQVASAVSDAVHANIGVPILCERVRALGLDPKEPQKPAPAAQRIASQRSECKTPRGKQTWRRGCWCTRLGAFEVYLGVVIPERGACFCEQLHSKLATSTWPEPKPLAELVLSRLAAASLPVRISVTEESEMSGPLGAVAVIIDGVEAGRTGADGCIAVPGLIRLTEKKAIVSIACERGTEGLPMRKKTTPHPDPCRRRTQQIDVGLDAALAGAALYAGGETLSVSLRREARWFRIFWGMDQKDGRLRMVIAPKRPARALLGSRWHSGSGLALAAPQVGAEAQAEGNERGAASFPGSIGTEGWVLLPTSLQSILIFPPSSAPGFGPALVHLNEVQSHGNQAEAADRNASSWHELKVTVNRRLLRVFGMPGTSRLLLRLGGPAKAMPEAPWVPLRGICVHVFGPRGGGGELSEASCPQRCGWRGPRYLMTGHLSECKCALEVKRAALSSSIVPGPLSISLVWSSTLGGTGSEQATTSLELRVRHPCGEVIGSDHPCCSLCGGCFETGLVQGLHGDRSLAQICWPSGAQPPSGIYEVRVSRSSGPATASDLVVCTGTTSRAVAVPATCGAESCRSSVVTFEWPPAPGVLSGSPEAREASRWQLQRNWSSAHQEREHSLEHLSTVTDDDGWCVVPRDGETLWLMPPASEIGLVPAIVPFSSVPPWGDDQGQSGLEIDYPCDHFQLRVLRRCSDTWMDIRDAAEFRVHFGGESQLPGGWEPVAGVLVQVAAEVPPEDISCPNAMRGCTWHGPPDRLKAHMHDCSSTMALQKLVEKAGAMRGLVQVSLSWVNGSDQPSDLDLKVDHPCGNISHMMDGPCACGGVLDIDDRGSSRFETSVENISWPDSDGATAPPDGSYSVLVTNFEGPAVAFQVVVKVASTVRLFRGVAPSAELGGDAVRVCDFTLPFSGSFDWPREDAMGTPCDAVRRHFSKASKVIAAARSFSTGLAEPTAGSLRTSAEGWCTVTSGAQELLVFPPDDWYLNRGFQPAHVRWSNKAYVTGSWPQQHLREDVEQVIRFTDEVLEESKQFQREIDMRALAEKRAICSA